jgi:hypothetical protein
MRNFWGNLEAILRILKFAEIFDEFFVYCLGGFIMRHLFLPEGSTKQEARKS